MLIIEKLKTISFIYKGSRKSYIPHDPAPYVLVLDKNYKGDSILGWNLNYYDGNKDELISMINDAIKHIKWYHKRKNLKKYKIIKEQFPLLSRFIRRYKKWAITYVKEF